MPPGRGFDSEAVGRISRLSSGIVRPKMAPMSKLDPLRQAVAVSPDNIPLLLLLAHACLDEWSLDEARSIFERVLAIDPTRPEARVGIARILHLSGKTSEAVVRTEALIVQ